MTPNDQEESKIRDFLASRIEHLPTLIANLDTVKDELREQETRFNAIDANQGGPTAIELIRRILAKRNLRGIGSLYSLELIDTEFVLLNTGKPGFQPSADILVRSYEDSRLFLFEVKRLVGTERQAVTELAAYSNGLNARFWNITANDYSWVPICTEWRTTVRAAFANEATWQHRSVLPMQCNVTKDSYGEVCNIELELLTLLEDIDEPLALSQFAWECFDVMTFQLSKKPSDPRTLLEFINAMAASRGFSGCVMEGESLAGDYFPYPYVFALVVHNPMLAALKRRQLEIVLNNKHGERIEMRKHVKKPLFSWHDLDFKTMEDRSSDDSNFLSVREMAMASGNRISDVFDEIKARLDLFCDFEIGIPSFKGFLEESIPIIQNRVSYFGLMQEVVYERLQWEMTHANGGDGPVIGGIGSDPVAAICSPHLFFEFMNLMNFEHESQTDYYEDSDEYDEDESKI